MSGRESALRLIAERDSLEKELEKTRRELASHKVGLNEPLVTADGFPRHDLDVATVRQLRVQLIRQENDMKALLEQIRQALASAFPAKQRSSGSVRRPFCIVKSVVSGSLADEAGLKADDEILEFGKTSRLADMPAELKSHLGSDLRIEIVRQGKPVELSVTVTEGRSLGCHVVPI